MRNRACAPQWVLLYARGTVSQGTGLVSYLSRPLCIVSINPRIQRIIRNDFSVIKILC